MARRDQLRWEAVIVDGRFMDRGAHHAAVMGGENEMKSHVSQDAMTSQISTNGDACILP